MKNNVDYAAVIAAIIGAIALMKTATIGYNERKQRAHWFFDDYVSCVGKFIECKDDGSKKDYYFWYYRYYIYSNPMIREKMESVDNYIKKEEWSEAQKEIFKMLDLYKSLYDLTQYLPRKRKKKLHFY